MDIISTICFTIGPATVTMECNGHPIDILVGVASFGLPSKPKVGYYTSVFGNREWICKTMGENNIDLC